MSALPAASRTLFGCQSIESTVERMGFLSSRETHQSLSGSNEQTAIALHNAFSAAVENPELDSPRTASNSEFVLERAPTHKGRRTVNTQEH
jgi:hypothetical protein